MMYVTLHEAQTRKIELYYVLLSVPNDVLLLSAGQ